MLASYPPLRTDGSYPSRICCTLASSLTTACSDESGKAAVLAYGVFRTAGCGTWHFLLCADSRVACRYQICQFIVALRTSHFLTVGVGAAMFGCFQAYRCAIHYVSDGCAAIAPTITLYSGCFWLLQIAITARSLALLPHSYKKGQRVSRTRRDSG